MEILSAATVCHRGDFPHGAATSPIFLIVIFCHILTDLLFSLSKDVRTNWRSSIYVLCDFVIINPTPRTRSSHF